MINSNNSKTYSTSSSRKLGFLSTWIDIFKELYASRELILILFYRDFFGAQKQSLFGYIWIIVLPILTVGTFFFLKKSGVVTTEATDVPYFLYAMIGFSLWSVFATGLVNASMSLVLAGNMLIKINFPRKTLAIAAMGSPLIEFIIRTIMIVILFIVYGVTPSWNILLFPILVIPLFIFTLALGYLMSLFNAILRDIGAVLPLVLSFLMFATPVLYPPTKDGFLFYLSEFNPMSHFIVNIRNFVIYGYMLDVNTFIIFSVFSIVFLFFSLRVFHMIETQVIERI